MNPGHVSSSSPPRMAASLAYADPWLPTHTCTMYNNIHTCIPYKQQYLQSLLYKSNRKIQQQNTVHVNTHIYWVYMYIAYVHMYTEIMQTVNTGACRVGSAHIVFCAANCTCDEVCYVFGVVFLYLTPHHFHQVREPLLRGSEGVEGRRKVKRRATCMFFEGYTHAHTHTHTHTHTHPLLPGPSLSEAGHHSSHCHGEDWLSAGWQRLQEESRGRGRRRVSKSHVWWGKRERKLPETNLPILYLYVLAPQLVRSPCIHHTHKHASTLHVAKEHNIDTSHYVLDSCDMLAQIEGCVQESWCIPDAEWTTHLHFPDKSLKTGQSKLSRTYTNPLSLVVTPGPSHSGSTPFCCTACG